MVQSSLKGFAMTLSNRKVGGIRFIKVGRLTLSVSISKAPPRKPLDAATLAGDCIAALPIVALVVGLLAA